MCLHQSSIHNGDVKGERGKICSSSDFPFRREIHPRLGAGQSLNVQSLHYFNIDMHGSSA